MKLLPILFFICAKVSYDKNGLINHVADHYQALDTA